MKTISTFLLIMTMLYSIGQTKEETQNWINEKIELFSFCYEDIQNVYSLHFTGENMILTNKYSSLKKYENKVTTTYFYYEIPIKEMTSITFEEKTYNVWLYIKIRGGKNLIKCTRIDNVDVKHLDRVEIILNKSVNQDDMRNRLTKAFDHLVELYGGQIMPNVF